MNVFINSVLRKIVFFLAGSWITKLIQSGIFEQGQIEQWIELTLAILTAVFVACWTKYLAPRLQRKKTT